MDPTKLLEAVMQARAELQAARSAFWSYMGPHQDMPLDPAAAQQRYDEKVRRLLVDALDGDAAADPSEETT